LQIAFICGLQM